ncbi:MAG: YkgJ family cysteine cluster protein [Gemmataceae bacterium]
MPKLFKCSEGHHWQATRAGSETCPICGLVGAGIPPTAFLTAKIDLNLAGEPINLEVTVPVRPVRRIELLPVFQSVAEVIIDQAVQKAEAGGAKVSCKAGCGACCRQLVPITETEAHRIRNVVAEMPKPRRSEILARFAHSRNALQKANLLEPLLQPTQVNDDDLRPFGLKYFFLGIPCPFLENESCSIYPDRPIACREYLVTSPAENCKNPTSETVTCIKPAAKVSNAVARLDNASCNDSIPWVPLILAPEWAKAHPEEPPVQPGPDLIQRLFYLLARR